MSYSLSYSDQVSLGMTEPDDDAPVFGRCAGPSIPSAYGHGCGRFVANHGTICPRCVAESDVYWAAEIAENRAMREQQTPDDIPF